MRLVCLYNPNTSQIFHFCNMHDGNRLQTVAMGQMPPVGVMQKSAKALLGISQHSLTTGLVKEMQQKPNTGSPETCKWETGKVKGMIQNLWRQDLKVGIWLYMESNQATPFSSRCSQPFTYHVHKFQEDSPRWMSFNMKRPYGLWDPSCSMLKPITWQVPPWPLVNDQNWTSKLDWRSKKEKENPSQLANNLLNISLPNVHQNGFISNIILLSNSTLVGREAYTICHWNSAVFLPSHFALFPFDYCHQCLDC